MPTWLIGVIVKLVLRYGLPVLEKKFPGLAPILDEILKVLVAEQKPSEALLSTASHYAACSGVACETRKY